MGSGVWSVEWIVWWWLSIYGRSAIMWPQIDNDIVSYTGGDSVD